LNTVITNVALYLKGIRIIFISINRTEEILVSTIILHSVVT